MPKHGRHASVLSKAVAVTAMAFVASSAHALLFNGSYTVTSNSSSSAGLAVGMLNDFGSAVTATTNSFTGLNVTTGGAVHFTDLFEIFAVHSPPYTGNDLIPQAITIGFTFSSPSAASGTLIGTTVGTISGSGLSHFAKPIDLTFNGQSILEITLSDPSSPIASTVSSKPSSAASSPNRGRSAPGSERTGWSLASAVSQDCATSTRV